VRAGYARGDGNRALGGLGYSTARMAEPQEAGHWPDYDVCELRLDHGPAAFDVVWLWDVDVESRACL